jgi:hypothetical protein
MPLTERAAELPDVLRADLVPLEAEIAALEKLQEGLEATAKQLVDNELHHRAQKDRLTAVEPEPKTLDFIRGGDWHAAHADWERRAAERKERLAEVTEARDRAWRTFVEFSQWIVEPAAQRLKELRAKRDEIVTARMGLCQAAKKAAWKGGMIPAA